MQILETRPQTEQPIETLPQTPPLAEFLDSFGVTDTQSFVISPKSSDNGFAKVIKMLQIEGQSIQPEGNPKKHYYQASEEEIRQTKTWFDRFYKRQEDPATRIHSNDSNYICASSVALYLHRIEAELQSGPQQRVIWEEELS